MVSRRPFHSDGEDTPSNIHRTILSPGLSSNLKPGYLTQDFVYSQGHPLKLFFSHSNKKGVGGLRLLPASAFNVSVCTAGDAMGRR